MLTSKQRAFLRGLAVEEETILTVGKGGIGPEVIRQADGALAKRELIKGRVLPDTCPLEAGPAAALLAQETGSEVVQVIGSRFVLYRRRKDKPLLAIPRR